MQSNIENIHNSGAEVIAVCVDPIKKNAEITNKLNLDFPILSDPDLIAIDAYGIRHHGGNIIEESDIARPALFILDRKGVIRWRNLTDNWRVRTHPKLILEKLKAIP